MNSLNRFLRSRYITGMSARFCMFALALAAVAVPAHAGAFLRSRRARSNNLLSRSSGNAVYMPALHKAFAILMVTASLKAQEQCGIAERISERQSASHVSIEQPHLSWANYKNASNSAVLIGIGQEIPENSGKKAVPYSNSAFPVLTSPSISLSPFLRDRAGTGSLQNSNNHRYWNKRRLIVLTIGLAIAGAGAGLWVKGKDIPNANYNPNACQAALLSGGVGTGLNAAGDAAVGQYCNETVPSAMKKAGLWLMIGGGGLTAASFVPGL